MTAEAIAKALGGRKAGAAWMAKCPAHKDREPSLSIKDADCGKVLVRFPSCDNGGKAPVDPQRMMLGPCRGGAVRLRLPGDVLMVGEGIEACLAAMRATGYPAWAALSTSGLHTPPTLWGAHGAVSGRRRPLRCRRNPELAECRGRPPGAR
jgi:hypothetical protein